eukprot:8425-Heterococcus_DN1.PRE.1
MRPMLGNMHFNAITRHAAIADSKMYASALADSNTSVTLYIEVSSSAVQHFCNSTKAVAVHTH